MRNKRLNYLTLVVMYFLGFAQETTGQSMPIERLIDIYNHPQNYPNYVMVAAHRGYWKDRPENSLSAIQASIDLGADMVELDLRRSKDGVLVIAHDRWLGRLTTNRKGSTRPIDQMNYIEFKDEFLLDSNGKITDEHIPTFDQALEICRGKILVNLDKIELFFTETFNAVKNKRMLNQVVFKFKAGKLGDPQQLRETYGAEMINQMMLTPILFFDNVLCFPQGTTNCRSLTHDQLINAFITDPDIKCPGFELIFINESDVLFGKAPAIRANHKRLIHYPEWPEACSGNWDPNDQKWKTPTKEYINDNKRNDWYWLVGLDAQHRPDLIISDRLEVLIQFLEINGLRNLN